MGSDWLTTARERLLRLRDPRRAAWGYRAGATPGVEPTVLACLGLLATDPDPAGNLPIARDASSWLATVQNPDGSLSVSATQHDPGWATPYAVLLWAALGRDRAEVDRAAHWLLGVKPHTMPQGSSPSTGHDTSITGWPWVPEAHSWVEPTALSLLALRRAGCSEHPRVRDGLRLIRDRALAAGGWNFGSTTVLGRELRPQPGPTGLALLALAGVDDRTEVVERAIAYLLRTLPGVRSAQSLGWGLLGLNAWGERPDQAGQWLDETCRRVLPRPDAAPRLASLLLADGAGAPELLGTRKKGGPH